MKKIFSIIIVLISITFLNACNKDSSPEVKTEDNNIIGAGITADKPTNELSVDTAADLGVSSETAKKPKLPKIPSGAQAGIQENNANSDKADSKVEAEVKSILSDITKEENLNQPETDSNNLDKKTDETPKNCEAKMDTPASTISSFICALKNNDETTAAKLFDISEKNLVKWQVMPPDQKSFFGAAIESNYKTIDFSTKETDTIKDIEITIYDENNQKLSTPIVLYRGFNGWYIREF